VKLAELISWEDFEAHYAQQLSEDMGATAESFRMALGALIIKERLGTSDLETVEQIRENPYLQYFLGLTEYGDKALFEASMLVPPADIRYLTDLSLLNEAREHTEHIINLLYAQVQEQVAQKPRTYRRKARQQYLHIAKQRQVSRKARRKAVGQ
jgi:transposase, IS5 family